MDYEPKLLPWNAIKLLLTLHLCKAIAAVYRSVTVGLERNFSFPSALVAYCCEHFSGFACCILACIAASLASLGLILESLLCVKFLLACCEYEIVAAFLALKGLVLVHLVFPRFKNMEKISALGGIKPPPLKPTLLH